MTIDTRPTPARLARRRTNRRRRAVLVVMPLAILVLVAFGVIYRTVLVAHREVVVKAPTLALTPIMTSAEPINGKSSNGGATVQGGSSIDAAWLQTTAAATGISVRALEGYGKAQLMMAASNPGCKLGWNTLAGIGWIETGHGTTRGSVLLPDGRTSKLILGPALDGTKGTRAIKATEADAAATGDPDWDHAAGPMQFIGGTWARWALDGNGDGIRDRNNIDDASLAAASYLCAGNRDLSTADGWSSAIHSYNHSNKYVLAVNDRANMYAEASAS